MYKSVRHTATHEIVNQRRATRLYIVLFILSIFIFSTYVLLIVEPKRTDVQNPTFDIYGKLQKTYGNVTTIQCPCKHLSVSYEFILKLDYVRHHICHTNTLLIQYFGLVFSDNFFPSVRTLCKWANDAIVDGLNSFYRTKLVTPYLLKNDTFVSQINLTIETFQRLTVKRATHMLEFIHDIIQINHFIVPFSNTGINFINAKNGVQSVMGNKYYKVFVEQFILFLLHKQSRM